LEVYKKLNGVERLEETQFFNINVRATTRGNIFKLQKKRFKTDLGKYNFGNRVINDWNALPDSIAQSSSVNIFKGRLDHFIGRTRGTE
jgi:hypothetical protein